MARLAPEELAKRAERAWTLKRPYYGLFTESWRYAAPGIDPYRASGGDPAVLQSTGSQGQPRHDHLFDGTLARAAANHANMMTSTLFPAGRDWAQLTEGPLFGPDVDDETERRRALKMIQNKAFQTIHASNFVLAVNAMAFDGVVSGTGCMKVGVSADSSTVLEFDAVNQSEVAFERGPRGDIWGFFRQMQVTATHIPVLWPGASGVPAASMEDGLEKRWGLLEATYYDPEEGIWRYDVLLKHDDHGRTNAPIFERDYIVCPWVAWRYSLPPGDVQGRSPVQAALPDSRTANHAVRVRLQSASMRVAGMFTYKAEDVFNPRVVHMRSGGFIPVGSNDSTNPTIRPLELPGDPQMGELVLEDHRQAIRDTMLDLALPDPAGPVRSATEIIERQREAQQRLGMPYLRLIEEVGRPVLRATTYLLAEAGQLPELATVMPAGPDGKPAPLMLDGRDVKVSFSSPMVMAQQLSDAETTIRWGEMSQRIAGPQGWQAAVKVEEIPALLAEKMGAPPELVRSERERAELAEELMAQQAQAVPQQPMQPGGML